MPPLPGMDRSTIAVSHTSGSRRSHGRAGLTAAAWRKERSYCSQQSPGTSRASLATMAMYMAKGTARWGEKCMATAIKVAKDKVQSAIEVTGNRFFLPSSFRSSVERSKAHSRASGRRSPKSIYLPSLILATSGPGAPKWGAPGSGFPWRWVCGRAAPAATVCVAIDAGCCGAVEARELTTVPRGWTSEELAGTELGLEPPAWGEPAAERNHEGTTGQTPDNVPADGRSPTETGGCGGQAHVPRPPTPGTRQTKSPLGVNCKVAQDKAGSTNKREGQGQD